MSNFMSNSNATEVFGAYAEAINEKTTQVSTMSTASADNLNKIVQFIGATTQNYTNGYFYKCVAGETSGTYKWVNVSVQSGGSGSVTDVKVGNNSVVDENGVADLGTAAGLNIASSGNAGNNEVVKGDDTRLSDARTPVSHTHTTSDITDFPTMSDYIQKSNTSGLIKNDGTIDINTYALASDIPAAQIQSDWNQSDNTKLDYIKNKPALGTASSKNVPSSGNASSSEVVLGNDTRLSDSRPASDVYSWAKASSKPSYTATEVGAIASTLKGTANGVAELDANGKVPSAQLPSYVDDVLEYASTSAFPSTGETGKIYIALDTNKTYRWGGSEYAEISESLALGETSSTAYFGDKGKANADNISTIQGLIPSGASTSNKLATASDIPDISGKADKSEMSVSASGDKTTIQLKSGTSAEVINAHQDISGKADKSEMSVTDGTGTDVDKTTIQLKSGTSATVLKTHQDISGKADKVSGATNGNLAGLDASGNLTDSGVAKTDIDAMQDELSTDYAEVTGNPINFSTLSAQNAKSTILSLEPIQDLHGYDKPWVGGAGKNKLPMTVEGIKAANTGGTWSGNVYTLRGVTYTIITDSDNNVIGISSNGIATGGAANFAIASNIGIEAGIDYVLSGCPSGGATNTYALAIQNANGDWIGADYDIGTGSTINKGVKTITISVSNGTNANDKIWYPMVRLLTETDATFAPYTNICPISGCTEIGILGCGKNLYSGADQSFSYHNEVPFSLKAGTYTVSALTTTTASNRPTVIFYNGTTDLGRVYIASSESRGSGTITLAQDVTSLMFQSGETIGTSAAYSATFTDIQIEVGNQSSSYKPYTKSNDLTISLGQTVYGGTLDVENGVLVVDRTYQRLLKTYGWALNTTINRRFDLSYNSSIMPIAKNVNKTYISSHLDAVNIGINNHTFGVFYISSMWIVIPDKDSYFETIDDFKDWLNDNDVYICYELAEPITIQLTPHQISLLEGVNNISIDDDFTSISLTYRDGSVATLNDVKQVEESVNDVISVLSNKADKVSNPTSGNLAGLDSNSNLTDSGIASAIFPSGASASNKLITVSEKNNLTSRTPRDITNDLSNLAAAVAEQNLEKYGYKIGDYFDGTSQSSDNFRYWLADMDTFYGGYDYYAVEPVHHIGIVVDTMQSSQWYTSSDISDVGYNQSTLHSYLSGSALDIIKADMIALFGGSTGLEHLLGQSKLWNKLGTWYWSDENTHSQYIAALTECQLAGAKIWSADNYQQGEGHKQLNLFAKYSFNQIFGWTWIWLRSIASSGSAVDADDSGYVGVYAVALSGRAAGLILFH